MRHWRAWNHWRRGRDFTLLDDDIVRIVGWGSYISGGCVALTVAASYAAGQVKGLNDLDFQVLLHGVLVLLMAWWGLACLGGWGLQRGLRWAFVLQCVGGVGVICLTGPAIAIAAYAISNQPGPAGRADRPGGRPSRWACCSWRGCGWRGRSGRLRSRSPAAGSSCGLRRRKSLFPGRS